eukprot:scpid87621/ scgid30181/ 
MKMSVRFFLFRNLLLSMAIAVVCHANNFDTLLTVVTATYQGRRISQDEILFSVQSTETLLCQVIQANASSYMPCIWRRGIERQELCNASLSTFAKKQPTASPSIDTNTYQLVFTESVTSGIYECGTPSKHVAFYIINDADCLCGRQTSGTIAVSVLFLVALAVAIVMVVKERKGAKLINFLKEHNSQHEMDQFQATASHTVEPEILISGNSMTDDIDMQTTVAAKLRMLEEQRQFHQPAPPVPAPRQHSMPTPTMMTTPTTPPTIAL